MKDNDTNLEGEFREPERLVESKTMLLTLKLFSFFFIFSSGKGMENWTKMG